MDDFYRAFEEKYRGSRALIRSRQEAYLPFVEPVLCEYSEEGAFDIGCGRGEWLELLRDNSHRAFGEDLDQGMLDACIQLELNVKCKDALETLNAQLDESLAVITAFHVVEHIPFDRLQELVKQAYRVLVSGGLLILETPNPENIMVGSELFFLDHTHVKPIPQGLLAFLPEYYGFETVKVLRLQEDVTLLDAPDIRLMSVLNGVSPDYSIIAQKGGSETLKNALAPFFEPEYGVSIEQISGKYQDQLDSRYSEFTQRADKALALAQQAEHRAEQAEAKTKAVEEHTALANERADKALALAQQAEHRAEQAEGRLESILTSRSWKISKPLRLILSAVKRFSLNLLRNKFIAKERIILVLRSLFSTRPILRRYVLIFLHNIFGKRHTDNLISLVRDPSQAHIAPSSSPRLLSNYLSYNGASDYRLIMSSHFTSDLSDFESVIAADTGLLIDFNLIRALRRHEKIDLIKPLTQDDYDVVSSILLHIYLAYLRRFSSAQDVDMRSKRIIANNNINREIDGILKSAEFHNLGYMDMIK